MVRTVSESWHRKVKWHLQRGLGRDSCGGLGEGAGLLTPGGHSLPWVEGRHTGVILNVLPQPAKLEN